MTIRSVNVGGCQRWRPKKTTTLTIAAKPIFCIVLADDDRWAVEAEWPDGTIERVDTFETYFDAMNWITTRSDEWVRGRPDKWLTPVLPENHIRA